MQAIRILLLVLVACAPLQRGADQPLRVMVYNIHAGRDAEGKDNLGRVAELVWRSEADLVLLQEVDRKTRRSGEVDQLAELMNRTGMQGAYGKSLDFQGGEYGIAILSRWPIAATEVVPLRVTPPQVRAGGAIEPRVALVVRTNGLRVINTHLDASSEDTWRLQEVATLATLASGPDANLILGGDLNSTPDNSLHGQLRERGLRDAWLECGAEPGLTYPAAEPRKRIDYLLIAESLRCTAATVLDSTASDHRPLLVTISRR